MIPQLGGNPDTDESMDEAFRVFDKVRYGMFMSQ